VSKAEGDYDWPESWMFGHESEYLLDEEPRVGDEIEYCGGWRRIVSVCPPRVAFAQGGVMRYRVKEQTDATKG
jgi:hypothetical protein